jgi:hypothetical protein
MYRNSEQEAKELIAKLIEVVCEEQYLHKEVNDGVITLINKIGIPVFEYDSSAAFTVTSFIKYFSEALKENLL